MTLVRKVDPAGARETRGVRLRRIVRRTFYVKLAVAFVVLLAAGIGYLRLAAGPVSLQDYSGRVGDALATRLGPGWRVAIADTALELQGAKPAVRASGLEIRNPAGILVVNAPTALVTLDPISLLTGRLTPREVDLHDLHLRASIAEDGTLSFVPPTDGASGPPVSPPASTGPVAAAGGAGGPPPSPLSQAVSSLLAPLLKPTGPIGALDRATVSDAKLTLVGSDGHERVAFGRVDAIFERDGEAGRRMAIQLEGQHGAWSVDGRVRDQPDGQRLADIRAGGMPLTDVLLLAGLSGSPASSDLKLTGSAAATLANGRLTKLDGRFETSPGFVFRAGQPPMRVDQASVEASWDESRRRLDLPSLSVRSGETHTQLSGELDAGHEGWQLKLGGRDTVVAGLTERDPAFRVADLAAEVQFDEHGIVIDRLTLKGDQLNFSLSGASTQGGESGGMGLRALVEAKDTNIRRFLRLWPDQVNPELRSYLIANLQSGTVSHMELRTDLNPDELKNVATAKPISDGSLSVTFGLTDAKLSVLDGLPPLSKLSAEGKATGTTTSLSGRTARIELPGGRQINFSDATYDQAGLDKPGSTAKIAFHLDGGADAFAAFLRSPVLKDAGAADLDPANLKGRVDLKVSLPLDPKRIPRAADMQIVIAGTATDVTAEHVMGREKLEGANLTVGYESGNLSLKGDGRLGGSPATFDLRQPRGGAGEVTTNLTLDDAARTRRGLPSAPSVSGQVAVKVVSPFGTTAKIPTKLEADLSRAAVDGLLPGWSKAAGKPTRVSFSMPDGDGAELRDFVLDSGPVQLRGRVGIGKDGLPETADLTTVKISPGDDMRAQVDRNGGAYRITLRGNVGDARPVLKWLGNSSSSSSGGGGKGRDPVDLDIDAVLNIVTGHNDEAMTGVVAKVSTRGRDLRDLRIKGQFRQASLEAELIRKGGQPLLSVQSADAGSILRFMDIYKRMIGGQLDVEVTPGDVQAGHVTIASFGLKNEPALKSIASAPAVRSDIDDRTVAQLTRLDSDQVQFTKLTGNFRRSASRVDYKDVVVWGPAVGFKLEGFVDNGSDRMDILGTFVPAYGLNNVFSQVPVVGLILGGDRDEGLFAIDFRVSGTTASPQLTVNPLTAVAPGILRKLFGWMMPEPETLATGTTAPRAPSARAATPRRTTREN